MTSQPLNSTNLLFSCGVYLTHIDFEKAFNVTSRERLFYKQNNLNDLYLRFFFMFNDLPPNTMLQRRMVSTQVSVAGKTVSDTLSPLYDLSTPRFYDLF